MSSSGSEHGHLHQHGHDHHHGKRRFCQSKTCRLILMIILTFMYFIVELVVGNITNSVALIADSFHMLSDVLALVIGVVAVRIVKRRSTVNTYGWVRAEVVGANINTVFLLALCLTIIFDAITRYVKPEPIEQVNMLLIVGAVGFGINIIGLFLFQGFHGHSHGPAETKPNIKVNIHEHNESVNEFKRHSDRALEEVIADCANETDENQSDTVIDMHDDHHQSKPEKKKASMNMHGVFLHVLADALGSIVVIISALIIKFVPHDRDDKKHWTVYVDPTLSILIVIIISISAVPFFRETTAILLQTIPKHLKIQEMKSQLLESVPEISSIHEFHVWRLTNEKIIVSAHLHRRNLSNYMLVAAKVKKFFHSIGIHSATIQYECEDNHSTPLLTTNTDNQWDKAGDCLLRCENNACDTQTCCTKISVRSNILLNTNHDHTMQIATVAQAEQYDNQIPLEQLSADASFQTEKF